MAKIKPLYVLYTPDGRLTVVDTEKQVWVYNDKINPSVWVKTTELPENK